MSQLNKIYEEAIQTIIENRLKKPVDNFEIIYSSGSSKGDNFIGIIKKIQVKDKLTNLVELNLIAKLALDDSARRSALLTHVFFNREAEFYRNVYPLYKKFQEQKGIDVINDGFYEVPYCYNILSEEPHEAFFLEDLKAINFEMVSRMKEPTKEHVILVMKVIAKMHAMFFAIKDQNPKLIEKYYEIDDAFISLFNYRKDSMANYSSGLVETALVAISKSQNIDMIAKVNKLLSVNLGDQLKKCFNRETTEPYATLCHGDCTNNNLLFRYDANGVPSEVRLLDFQIIRYASPVCDVVNYIFGCTTKALRAEYYQVFMDAYYSEFSAFLLKLGSNPEEIFPRKAFDEQLKKFGHFGLLMAVIYLPLFTKDEEDLLDLNELADSFRNNESESVSNKSNSEKSPEKICTRYESRMLEVCEDMYDLGYI